MSRLTIREAKQKEFGAFLRSRRERLAPEDVGLPRGSRRRTPGLRREEVAMLAGVGTTWYTWLEQGRDVQPSAEVLSALAETLRLNQAEWRHVFVLNDLTSPGPIISASEGVTAPLMRILESLTMQPAYILGRRWDVLSWNRAATVLFGDYSKLVGDERNIMHLLFLNKHHRRLLIDWDVLAPAALAMFRADSARYVGDPDFVRLIDTLQRSSLEFEKWWSRHIISAHVTNRKSIKHPVAGRMLFEYSSFVIAEQQEMKLVVYTPLDEQETPAKLNQLLSST